MLGPASCRTGGRIRELLHARRTSAYPRLAVRAWTAACDIGTVLVAIPRVGPWSCAACVAERLSRAERLSQFAGAA